MYCKNFACLFIVAISSLNAHDNVVKKLMLVMQQGRIVSHLVTLEQTSLVADNMLSPQAMTFEVANKKVQELVNLLLRGDSVRGTRIMLVGPRSDGQHYAIDDIAQAALYFLPDKLIFMPLKKYNEQGAFEIEYSGQDLEIVGLLCGRLVSPVYFDISDPDTLKDFSNMLLQACTFDGEIKLPSLGKIIELLDSISEHFADKITV